MKEIVADEALVAMCGLYCGACRAYLKAKCAGCAQNDRATWCKVRACCKKMGYSSCAECAEFADPAGCMKFNNFIARTFGILLNSDRRAGVLMIREEGRLAFAKRMAASGRQAVRRWGA